MKTKRITVQKARREVRLISILSIRSGGNEITVQSSQASSEGSLKLVEPDGRRLLSPASVRRYDGEGKEGEAIDCWEPEHLRGERG